MAPELSPLQPESRSSVSSESKRTDFITWEEYFMSVALLASQRSKDPVTQVGAAIVRDQVVVGMGYNGMPRGCLDDDMPWGKTSENPLENKYLYVCHAEMNAILNKNAESIRGATIYCTLFPCCSCAKYIIQAGISEVVYLNDKPNNNEMIASKMMFEKTNVKFRQFVATKRKVIINFDNFSVDISSPSSARSSSSSDAEIL
ncbi:hypothetical protein L596_008225 [Steinernema carpocapsae]|uniref:Probable deoxycytidylate deaminase n=1 Tax=Steinernema carpocapsae TaxID=34508 RepID=A0A4U5PBU1_STECR|nr:hypothetical protein L596_008225 [Steinernema carpocapsae]